MAPTPSARSRRALAGVALALALAGGLAQAAPRLPGRLAGLAATRVARGAEGIAEVRRLHGRGFPMESGTVAVFGRDAATLWVAEARSARAARVLVRDMAARIGEGRSPFTPLPARSHRGREVHPLSGLGQRHFYFRSGARVVWLAADSARAETALAEALRFYP